MNMNKANDSFSLTPRWCEEKDILRGWVIVHKSITHPRELRHLNYVELSCLDKKKIIMCRIFGPGSRPYNGDQSETVKKSIYLDAHFQQLLGIDEASMGKKQYNFSLKKITPVKYLFNSLRYHPDDGIRLSSLLGLVSLFLGLVSLFTGLLSLYLTNSSPLIVSIFGLLPFILIIIWLLQEYYRKS